MAVIPESPEVIANHLNKFLPSIVQKHSALPYQLPTDVLPPAFPSISPSVTERRNWETTKNNYLPFSYPVSSYYCFL